MNTFMLLWLYKEVLDQGQQRDVISPSMGPTLKCSSLPGRTLPALMLSGPSLLLPPPFVQPVLPDAARLVDALSAFLECSWSCPIAMPFLSV